MGFYNEAEEKIRILSRVFNSTIDRTEASVKVDHWFCFLGALKMWFLFFCICSLNCNRLSLGNIQLRNMLASLVDEFLGGCNKNMR